MSILDEPGEVGDWRGGTGRADAGLPWRGSWGGKGVRWEGQ